METHNKYGFTLIELLVVVLIIGILAAVAVPQYKLAVLKSHYATVKNLTKALANAEEIYYLANGQYTTVLENLDIDFVPQSTISEENDNLYQFKEGSCAIFNNSVACSPNTTPLIYFKVWYQKSSYLSGKYQCIAYSTDVKDTANQVCKQETKQTNPGVSSDHLTWTY